MVRIEVGASLDKEKSIFFAVLSGLLTQRSISVKDRLSKGPVYVHVLSLPNYNPKHRRALHPSRVKELTPQHLWPATLRHTSKRAILIRETLRAMRETASYPREEL